MSANGAVSLSSKVPVADPVNEAGGAHSAWARLASRRVWSVLAVEDDPDDLCFVAATLREAPDHPTGEFRVIARETIAAAVQYLRNNEVDLVLLDLSLPDSVGLAGLAAIRSVRPDLPVVVLTGQDDEVLALRALREGAQDYILKTRMFPTLLTRSLRHAIERKLTERARVASESRYRQLLETANEGVWTFDASGMTDYANPRTGDMLGYSCLELIGHAIVDFAAPADVESLNQFVSRRTAAGRNAGEFRFVRKDESELCALVSTSALVDADGEFTGYLAVLTDLTERREAEKTIREREEQLRESQKLEAIGRLAGGVAHDFNNMLTVITTYTGLVMESPGLDPALAADLAEVAAAADRAAALTGQLLAFSRKQLTQYAPVDVNEVIEGVSRMLRPLIGEGIALNFELAPSLRLVLADPRQLEQVVVNLGCNARDAMSGRGTLTIVTANLHVPAERSLSTPALAPGDYVLMEVADTGSGIDPSAMPQIFEPFFTTKEVGLGTGLGLSTVYGIVKQAGGQIWCESVLGHGSVFRIALPVHARAAATPDVARARPAEMRGTERVLLVEDEDAVREVLARVLAGQGFQVTAASNGADALDALRDLSAVDILITDLVMPGMSGPEFIAAAINLCPGAKVIYMSGYSSQDTWKKALMERHDAFLQKPFTVSQLTTAIRSTMDATPAAS